MPSNLKPASTLRIGHVTKKTKGVKQYVVKNKHGKHVWAPATTTDVKCSKYLSGKIKKLTHESKSKKASRIKTHDQAIAVAYSMTKKKYPNCGLLQ
jgi:hypothetical protein